MNITVYLGANEGTDPALKTAVQELGKWIGESGNALIYGGSRCGLMGVLADSVLAAGGEVTGVEPEFFVKGELQHDGLTDLIVTKDMTERKTKMIELGDAFIAFPGGTGTGTSLGQQTIGAADAAITVTNIRDAVTPTGLLLDAAPYGAMLALAVGSGAVVFRKRRCD